MNKELISKINNHFTKVESWIDAKEPGFGITLSVNKTVIPKEYKKKISEFTPENSISDLIQHGFIENVTIEIYRIISEYLALNIKSKSINTSSGISVLFEHIIEECGNLELQELNFIFKSGIMGKFGIIYNDISIDTICGTDGWIEKYYSEFRRFRPETKPSAKIDFTGNEMSIHEYLKKHPIESERFEIRDILLKAKTYRLEIDDVKRFYEIKGLNKIDDLQEDMVIFSRKYFSLDEEIRNNIPEMKFILMEFSKFVINNWNKVKG